MHCVDVEIVKKFMEGNASRLESIEWGGTPSSVERHRSSEKDHSSIQLNTNKIVCLSVSAPKNKPFEDSLVPTHPFEDSLPPDRVAASKTRHPALVSLRIETHRTARRLTRQPLEDSLATPPTLPKQNRSMTHSDRPLASHKPH